MSGRIQFSGSVKFGRYLPNNPTRNQLNKMSINDLIAFARHLKMKPKDILINFIRLEQFKRKYK